MAYGFQHIIIIMLASECLLYKTNRTNMTSKKKVLEYFFVMKLLLEEKEEVKALQA